MSNNKFGINIAYRNIHNESYEYALPCFTKPPSYVYAVYVHIRIVSKFCQLYYSTKVFE